MSKKKKNRKGKRPLDPWEKFINDLLRRERADRACKIPVAYVRDIAHKICSSGFDEQATYNALIDFYGVVFEKGYTHKSDEVRRWNKLRSEKLKRGFDAFRDEIDDLIHNKKTE